MSLLRCCRCGLQRGSLYGDIKVGGFGKLPMDAVTEVNVRVIPDRVKTSALAKTAAFGVCSDKVAGISFPRGSSNVHVSMTLCGFCGLLRAKSLLSVVSTSMMQTRQCQKYCAKGTHGFISLIE